MNFQLTNPFPLLSPDSYTEQQAEEHAAQADHALGFKTELIESILMHRGCRLRAPQSSKEHQQLWIGLDPRRLQTPYLELRRLLNELPLKAGQTVVDLGAGYGRMGFVLNHVHPDASFIGCEYVGERVQEARRVMKLHSLNQSQMIHTDLNHLSFVPPQADYYFIYDFGHAKAVSKILFDLKRTAATRPIYVIGRGKLCRELIASQHHWLVCRSASEKLQICTSESFELSAHG